MYAGLITDNGGTGTLGVSLGVGVSGPTGPTTLTLSGSNNTYTGVTNIQGNTSYNYNTSILTVSTLANGLIPSSIGASSNLATNLVLDYGGVLKYAGSTTSTDRLFSVGKDFGGMIDASGTGPGQFRERGHHRIQQRQRCPLPGTGGHQYRVQQHGCHDHQVAAGQRASPKAAVALGCSATWLTPTRALPLWGAAFSTCPRWPLAAQTARSCASTSAASNLVLAGWNAAIHRRDGTDHQSPLHHCRHRRRH